MHTEADGDGLQFPSVWDGMKWRETGRGMGIDGSLLGDCPVLWCGFVTDG